MITPKTRLASARKIARVAAGTLRDRLGAPRVHELTDVPATPHHLTPQWLTSALCGESSARVSDFSVEEISQGSTCRARLIPTYDGPADEVSRLPATVFVKSTSTFLTRLHVGATGAAGTESRFYRQIQPTIAVRSPRGYFGVADRASGRSILLLEDMAATRTVTFGDVIENVITRARAESLVETLASTHSALFESPRFEKDLSWMVSSLRLQNGLNRLVDFERRTRAGFDRAFEVIPPELRGARDRIHGYLMASFELDRGMPLGLVHTDVHAGNWFIENDDDMGLYDWAIIAKGQGTRDLAYALMSNLTVADRRAWERDLVNQYAASMSERTGVAFDPQQVWQSFRQQTMHGLCFWLYTIGSGRFQPDMQKEEVSLANIERMAQAVVDLDSFKALA